MWMLLRDVGNKAVSCLWDIFMQGMIIARLFRLGDRGMEAISMCVKRDIRRNEQDVRTFHIEDRCKWRYIKKYCLKSSEQIFEVIFFFNRSIMILYINMYCIYVCGCIQWVVVHLTQSVPYFKDRRSGFTSIAEASWQTTSIIAAPSQTQRTEITRIFCLDFRGPQPLL